MRIFASFVQCRKMRASIYQKIAYGPRTFWRFSILRTGKNASAPLGMAAGYVRGAQEKTLNHFHSTLC